MQHSDQRSVPPIEKRKIESQETPVFFVCRNRARIGEATASDNLGLQYLGVITEANLDWIILRNIRHSDGPVRGIPDDELRQRHARDPLAAKANLNLGRKRASAAVQQKLPLVHAHQPRPRTTSELIEPKC